MRWRYVYEWFDGPEYSTYLIFDRLIGLQAESAIACADDPSDAAKITAALNLFDKRTLH